MRKTALLSDIHGNLPALQAALADARSQGADRYVFLGDYVFDMPWSNEVCATLRGLENAVFIAGNKEERLHWLRPEDPEAGYKQFATVYQTLRELRPDHLDWLRSLPPEADVPLEGGETLRAVHFPERVRQLLRRRFSTQSYFRRSESTPPSHESLRAEFAIEMRSPEYAPFLDALDARVLAFGHNHMQHWCESRGVLLVDCGAVGVTADFLPGAAYTLLEEQPDGLRVTERRVSYDQEAAIRAAKDTEIYRRGPVWCELLFRSIRTCRDYMGAFLRYAYALANLRGIEARPLPDPFWAEVYDLFVGQLNAGVFYPQADRSLFPNELERRL